MRMAPLTFLFLSTFAAQAEPILWNHHTILDKLEGKTEHYLLRMSAEGSISPPRRDERPAVGRFVVWCRGNNPAFWIGVDGELVAGHSSVVDYRIGDGPPIKGQRWDTSTDNTSVGFWSGRVPYTFLQKVSKSDKLFIRIRDDIFGTSEFLFDTGGLAETIRSLPKECGKPL